MEVSIYSTGKPGPNTALMAGVHGDEFSGVEVLRSSFIENLANNIQGSEVVR